MKTHGEFAFKWEHGAFKWEISFEQFQREKNPEGESDDGASN